MRNLPIVITGPSGVGKGTVKSELLKADDSLIESISCTTRAPRKGEVDGENYFFITRREFESRIKENDFLEYEEVYDGTCYGTPRSFVERQLKEKSVILEIDVIGGLNAKRLMPQTVLIMLVPPTYEELRRRLVGRKTESEEEIQKRLNRVKFELDQQPLYDYVVINDDLKTTVKKVQEIINFERNRD